MSNIKFARPHRPSVEELAQGVLAGNRALLGRAITLIESNAVRDQESSRALISRLLPHSGNAVRIGITGVPGAGKSSFIEAFGTYLCKKGFKVAVLAIDPSSSVSRGSIMGDKTRMEELSGEENAFIRPSPSGGSLGGVARKTRETMIACEAAGFDIILIETVGSASRKLRCAPWWTFSCSCSSPAPETISRASSGASWNWRIFW